jgi:hypothetical protein
LEEVLMIAMVCGFPIFLFGVVAANVVVFKMQKVLNDGLAKEDRTSPWLVLGKGATPSGTVGKYRTKYADGPLYRQFRIAYWFCGIGGTLAIGSSLISKVVSR